MAKKKCEHDEQETLTLRFETEVYKMQKDGTMKADPDFGASEVEVASRCLKCGAIIKKSSKKGLKDVVDKAIMDFFK